MKVAPKQFDRLRLFRFATIAFAIAVLRAIASTTSAQTTGACEPGTASAELDIGNVRARLYNTGGLFFRGRNPVYEVPKWGRTMAIYASGIWVGGLVGKELRMAAATYSDWEFWPGPLDDQGTPPANCSIYDRIYVVDRHDLEYLETAGQPTYDIREWPWKLGAPVIDGDGDPDNYDITAGDRPEILGDQMAWWVMNDSGNEHLTTRTGPMGLEVQVSAFAFERDDPIGNSTFYRYRLINRGPLPLEQAYLGFWSDPDLGDREDDYVGSDSLLGMAFAYNSDNYDGGSQGYGSRPPALGYKILRGPSADSDGIDNDHDGTVDERGESRSMTSFMHYGSQRLGFPSLPIPAAQEFYNYLRARWSNGEPLTVGGSGKGDHSSTVTRFMFSGDPPHFWSEDQPTPGGAPNRHYDRRFIMATGPFDLSSGEVADIWLAILWAIGSDRLHAVDVLKDNARSVQAFFDDGLRPFPQAPTPEAPRLIAPAELAQQQPVNPTLQWLGPPNTTRYEVQVDDDVSFATPIASRIISGKTWTVEAPLPPNADLLWRVRGVNRGGPGPWSPSWRFRTGESVLSGGRGRLVEFENVPMFVEIAGPTESYGCGESPASIFGCAEVGGNYVYGSFNGTIEYIMYREGPGPEESITAFAPHDFEIRFTDQGSYAYQYFTTHAALWVPFEVWDIGPTYTGTNVNPNDPADDVRLIPVLFAGGRDECAFEYYNDPDLSPFGIWPGTTQRIFAYYPATTYADFATHIKPLVDEDPDGCPVVGDITEHGSAALVDIGRGRPLQRIIFEGDPEDDPPHPAFEVVIRFYTQEAIAPSVPIISAPLEGGGGLRFPITLAWNSTAPSHEVHVSSDSGFADTLIMTTAPTPFHVIESLPRAGSYFWRVRSVGGGVSSGWSTTARFRASPATRAREGPGRFRFTLDQNYPNPFQSSTAIRFALPSTEHVTLEVYDVMGRRVAQLLDAVLPPGRHDVKYSAGRVASGMYLYRIRAGSFRQTKTMLLLR